MNLIESLIETVHIKRIGILSQMLSVYWLVGHFTIIDNKNQGL